MRSEKAGIVECARGAGRAEGAAATRVVAFQEVLQRLVQRVGPPGAEDHKYTRGVVGIRCGSNTFPGAGVLSVGAALQTGVGMVRYRAVECESAGSGVDAVSLVAAAHPEAVFSLQGRTDAWVVGSGTAERTETSERELRELVKGAGCPIVLDAGGLNLLPQKCERPFIVTPHLGEFRKVACEHLSLTPEEWDREYAHKQKEFLQECAVMIAAERACTVLVKGSVTLIASAEGDVRFVGPSCAHLATAGSGDVLAGVIGGLCASYGARSPEPITPAEAVMLCTVAVALHSEAAHLTAYGSFSPFFTEATATLLRQGEHTLAATAAAVAPARRTVTASSLVEALSPIFALLYQIAEERP